MSLTSDIKDQALDLGYSAVGITTADDFTEHIQEVHSRGAAYDFFLNGPRDFMKGARPRAAMPSARSIIVLVWDYAQKAFPGTLLDKIGRIYLGRCYNPPPDRINGARFRLMEDYLKARGCTVGAGFMVPERRAAARAGVAQFGRNNFAYARGIGSFIVISALVVDQELEYDAPAEAVSCPNDCTRCMDACPTRALTAPFRLEPRRCLGFSHWWTQEGRPGVSSSIAPEIRAATGIRVHGCDLCQEACPRNAAKVQGSFPPDPFLEALAGRFSLPALLEMTDAFHAGTVQPIMYNYIKEKKYFQRNAAVALGNTGDPGYVPALARAMDGPESLVRGHAAWALGRIGGRAARDVLEKRRSTDPSAQVQAEIEAALSAAAGCNQQL
jgi:epoxyqueuosine reductase